MKRSVLNNLNLRSQLVRKAGRCQFFFKFSIDLNDNRRNIRGYFSYKFHIPLFKGLLHNSVVSIIEYFTGGLQRFVKFDSLQFKQSDKLRNWNDGMSIVKLNGNIFGKLSEIIAMYSFKLS